MVLRDGDAGHDENSVDQLCQTKKDEDKDQYMILIFFLHIFTKVSKFQWDMHRHRADHRCDIRMRLSVAVLRLARLAVGAPVGVAVGQGPLAAVAVGVLVVVVV